MTTTTRSLIRAGLYLVGEATAVAVDEQGCVGRLRRVRPLGGTDNLT